MFIQMYSKIIFSMSIVIFIIGCKKSICADIDNYSYEDYNTAYNYKQYSYHDESIALSFENVATISVISEQLINCIFIYVPTNTNTNTGPIIVSDSTNCTLSNIEFENYGDIDINIRCYNLELNITSTFSDFKLDIGYYYYFCNSDNTYDIVRNVFMFICISYLVCIIISILILCSLSSLGKKYKKYEDFKSDSSNIDYVTTDDNNVITVINP